MGLFLGTLNLGLESGTSFKAGPMWWHHGADCSELRYTGKSMACSLRAYFPALNQISGLPLPHFTDMQRILFGIGSLYTLKKSRHTSFHNMSVTSVTLSTHTSYLSTQGFGFLLTDRNLCLSYFHDSSSGHWNPLLFQPCAWWLQALWSCPHQLGQHCSDSSTLYHVSGEGFGEEWNVNKGLEENLFRNIRNTIL